MYDTQTRIYLVLEQAKKRQRNNWITTLCVLSCGILTLNVALMLYSSPLHGYSSPEDWMYGATLLPGNIGGYVLVAIVAFVIAVGVTVLCIKKREKKKQEENKG